jgi:nucleoid-associated protein YgaU
VAKPGPCMALLLAFVLAVLLAGCGDSPNTPATLTAVALPTLAPAPSPRPTTPAVTATPLLRAQTYVVEPGDTLALIARKVYGDASLWQQIYRANKDTIGDSPDALRVGMKLTIPPKG